MSRGSNYLSLNQATIRRETYRKCDRDFLIDAYNVLGRNRGNAAAGLSRYYQLRINSLIDIDRDDINYISKVSANNTKCIKCGTTRQLKIKRRRRANQSSERKYCRYLRGLSEEYCDKCQSKIVHHLRGKKAILFNRATEQPPPADKSEEEHVPPTSTTKSTKNKNKRKTPKQPEPPPKPAPPALRPAFSKRLRLAAAASKPAPQGLQPSSRLRAFSCLLKE